MNLSQYFQVYIQPESDKLAKLLKEKKAMPYEYEEDDTQADLDIGWNK